MIGLGIDTGGTYTDSAIVELDNGDILEKAKALTTREDLAVGITNSIDRLTPRRLREVKLISVSTTLATNSIVEGKGSRVGLIACGHEVKQDLPTDHFVQIEGGHDLVGHEREPLDLKAARAFILDTCDRIDAYAISSYLSVRNPEHEIALKALAGELCDRPIVCGRELTAELGFHERTITAVLNARLIAVIHTLIGATRQALTEREVNAPMMIVRGDGSLMSESVAKERPVETLLSGPAASVVGARLLTKLDDAVVVDVGGTTTDIAILREGRPRIAPEGAMVGKWQTRVKAVDMLTAGIGGDSRVVVMDEELYLSPRRAIPLSIGATLFPQLTEKLDQAQTHSVIPPLSYHQPEELTILQTTDFFTVTGNLDGTAVSTRERELIDLLKMHPCSLYDAAEQLGTHPYAFDVRQLEEWNVLTRISLTPTDALHVEGVHQEYSVEAARLGVQIESGRLQIDEAAFAARVREQVVHKITREIITKLVYDEIQHVHVPGCDVCRLLLKGVIDDQSNQDFSVNVMLNKPIIGAGAPAHTYLPEVAARMHSELIVPTHAEVANAIGAITGSIFETVEITIQPKPGWAFIEDPPCVLFAPDGQREYDTFKDALAYGELHGEELVRAAAERECAVDVLVTMERSDREGTVGGERGGKIFLESKLVFTANGKPGIAV